MDLGRRRFLWLLAGGAACTAAAGAQVTDRLRVVTERCDLGLRRPLRAAVLSDLHAPRYTFHLRHLHTEIERARPDVVLILGDTIDVAGNEKLFGELFGPLQARLGKFAILGNHEYWHDINRHKLGAAYTAAGVSLLVNRSVDLRVDGARLRLVGLDDWTTGHPDLSICPSDDVPTLVLSHCPVGAPKIAERLGAHAVILSGHTHGGQIAPFGHALHTPFGSGPYVRGWYDVAGHPLYVSVGLGNCGLNLRVGVPPTLVLLEMA
jgi:predicted MPP superfamily phosphohydrolase